MIIEKIKWQEFHGNGSIWIDGEIALVSGLCKHLFDIRDGFKGYEGKPICRIGEWKRYFDNGQLAWTLDFGDGTYDYKSTKKYPSYRKDGTFICWNKNINY